MSARRGWRERVEPGLYRAHRTSCPSSADNRPGRRCGCPYEAKAPGTAPGTTRTVTIAGTVTEARAERRRLMSEGRPDVRTPDVRAGTLDDFTGQVFRARSGSWAANTIRNREDDYTRRIAPTLGGLTLEEVDRPRVEGWLAGLIASGASRRAVVQSVATLRVFLGTAVEWGMLPENPARRLRLPRPDSEAPAAAERVIGRAELASLFEAAGGLRTETMLRACGEAGLRRAEVTGLMWGDVNLTARRLDIRRQVVQERLGKGKGHRKVVTVPKSGRGRRVALSAAFSAKLAAWWEESVVGGADAKGYVWPAKDGGPIHDRSVARALERACERAGLVANPDRGEDERAIPLVSPHRLRHSAASVMIREGVPWTVVSAQLGHADPAITARIYAHLLDERDLDLAAAVFDTETVGGTVGEVTTD